MEFLKRLFELLSNENLYFAGLTRLHNMLNIVNVIMYYELLLFYSFMYKKYEIQIKNMLLPSSHTEKVSEQLRNFGLLRLIFKLYTGLKGFKLEQAESSLFRLQRHLLYVCLSIFLKKLESRRRRAQSLFRIFDKHLGKQCNFPKSNIFN